MDLTEHPVEVVDRVEGVGAERQVDAVRPHEGDVGQVAVVELDLHLVLVRLAAEIGEALGRGVDGNDVGPLPGKGDRGLDGAAQFEDALALDVAAQLELGFCRDVGPVTGHVGRHTGPNVTPLLGRTPRPSRGPGRRGTAPAATS